MTDGKNSTAIKTYIINNVTAGGTVYILGGTAAVSDKVLSGLTGYTVKRLAGNDRYATNLKILEEAGVYDVEIIFNGDYETPNFTYNVTKKSIPTEVQDIESDVIINVEKGIYKPTFCRRYI